MAHSVLTDPAASPLLRLLWQQLPQIADRAGDAGDWRGWRVTDPEKPGAGYLRLVCRHELCADGGTLRRIIVALHAFGGGGQGAMHDHRWPLAVLPLAADSATDSPLYAMPWERRVDGRVREQGTRTIQHGGAYAIEDHTEIWHAVHSSRPHDSVMITNVTASPSRANRLHSEELPPAAAEEARRRIAASLRSVVAERAS